jgi:hypothetical protein
MSKDKSTITITVGDQAENHVDMQRIGELSEEGFTFEDLVKVAAEHDEYKLINLCDNCGVDYNPSPAYVLVLKHV